MKEVKRKRKMCKMNELDIWTIITTICIIVWCANASDIKSKILHIFCLSSSKKHKP